MITEMKNKKGTVFIARVGRVYLGTFKTEQEALSAEQAASLEDKPTSNSGAIKADLAALIVDVKELKHLLTVLVNGQNFVNKPEEKITQVPPLTENGQFSTGEKITQEIKSNSEQQFDPYSRTEVRYQMTKKRNENNGEVFDIKVTMPDGKEEIKRGIPELARYDISKNNNEFLHIIGEHKIENVVIFGTEVKLFT